MEMNLLEQTQDMLHFYNLSSLDVLWVGTKKIHTTWANFREIADFNFDNESEELVIPYGFQIVGKDWFFQWGWSLSDQLTQFWRYYEKPTKPPILARIKKIENIKRLTIEHLEDVRI